MKRRAIPMAEKQYKLICMAFDGEFIRDSIGTLEDCLNRSADMGSKWFFYPFHFIVTMGNGKVIETGSGLIDMKTEESYQSKLFKGRKLLTVQKVFKDLYKQAESEGLQLDALEYEKYMIDHCYKLLR
jgi:hypothetical protein